MIRLFKYDILVNAFGDKKVVQKKYTEMCFLLRKLLVFCLWPTKKDAFPNILWGHTFARWGDFCHIIYI